MLTLTSPLARMVLAGSLVALSACKSDDTPTASTSTKPPPTTSSTSAPTNAPSRAEISNEYTATAGVVGVDSDKRLVTLQREDGSQFVVRAGDAVRNFDQIAVGDKLRVVYKEVLVATKLPPGETTRATTAAAAGARMPEGEKPGIGVGTALNVRVRVESIDREHDIVVYSFASGELNSRRLQTPQGREFAKGLKIGDIVQLDYGQVLAVGIDKL
jgi:hypothetical protein